LPQRLGDAEVDHLAQGRAVVQRDQYKRQALAMMDHQNIARVLDAGTADSGRPYFVMELNVPAR
jgi:hypothetical protein